MTRPAWLARGLASVLERLQTISLHAAAREQGLWSLVLQLRSIVPDISAQYSSFTLDSAYLELKVRTLHAFQVRLATCAMVRLMRQKRGDGGSPIAVVDIGDSSGTHTVYLRHLMTGAGAEGHPSPSFLSANVDPVAVDKIRARGLDAVLCRAEELHERHGIAGALLMAFEVLEHLRDPVGFLDSVSRHTDCDLFVITVPYVARSRVALDHIRRGDRGRVTAETTHIFELSPSDWKPLLRHAGWEVEEERILWQFPRRSFLRLLRTVWRRRDYEGFYGVILRRDRTWADTYSDA